jgi:cation diffusion facilitator CzcD-associated flavoprotein CzcO
MNTDFGADVLIIGAGVAGLAAARDLGGGLPAPPPAT